MIPFTSESQRFDYKLAPDSVVLDFGGYEGNWAKGIVERHSCRVLVFEPVPKFYFDCVKNLTKVPGVSIYMFGVGGSNRYQKMRVSGDSTGAFSQNGPEELVFVRTLKDIMDGFALPTAELVKLNIENMEYETIEQAIADGTIKRIRDLQVQFHTAISGAEERRQRIQERLAETHELTYCEPFCWENWTRRP